MLWVFHRTILVPKQVEAANKVAMDGLKKMVYVMEGNWADKLENVLWAIRATPKMLSGETPFCLVYELEAIVQIEIAVLTHRLWCFNSETNNV